MKKRLIFKLVIIQIFSFTSISAATIWSIGGGLWSTTSTTGPDCSCSPAAGDDIIIDDLGATIGATMDLTGSITIKNGGELTFTASRNLVGKATSSVIVENGGSLIITGGLFPKETSTVTVENGGNITITGRLEITQNATVTVRGSIVMNGDKMAMSNNASLIVESTGSIDLPNGRMDINTGGTLTVDGTADVDGEFKLNGTMTGTGVITFGGPCSGGGTIEGFGESEFCDPAYSGVIDFEVLPIELLFFEGVNKDDQVIIKWATATEINNDFFTLESSHNGIDFEESKIIPGAGNNQTYQEYQWIDDNPFHGINYYRLKQTDFDGQFTYSDIISIRAELSSANFEVFPNPIADEIMYVRLNNHAIGKIVVNIYSSMGNKIDSREFDSNQESVDVEIDQMGPLNPGYYFVEVILNEITMGMVKIKKNN